jgi:hypothetical protein
MCQSNVVSIDGYDCTFANNCSNQACQKLSCVVFKFKADQHGADLSPDVVQRSTAQLLSSHHSTSSTPQTSTAPHASTQEAVQDLCLKKQRGSSPPEVVQRSAAPPSSSAVTTAPVAAHQTCTTPVAESSFQTSTQASPYLMWCSAAQHHPAPQHLQQHQSQLIKRAPHHLQKQFLNKHSGESPPDVVQCSAAPPSSSAVTTAPVAARTSGGPPKKIVPLPFTTTDSSAMAGM